MLPQLPSIAHVPDFAAELNEQQLAAVTTEARFSLVIAGAGSGKTRTLTYRVAWLLAHGVPGWRVLLLTFTNKAAREMLERVRKLVGPEAGDIWGGTFHSIANRILRRHAPLLGYRPGFSIMDTDDQKALIRNLVKKHIGKQSKTSPFPKGDTLLSLLSLAVNTMRPPEQTLREDFPQLLKHEDTILKIIADYTSRKREANTMDFDDLLANLHLLLEKHSEVRELYSRRFLHVLVDEYQDTNALQDRIIKQLCTGESTGLMAVGDDAQSIYSWRGAQVDHIFEFTKNFPGADVFKIETNYRSVPAILDISNAAIARNERRYVKTLRPARPPGNELPTVVPAPDNHTEAQFVAHTIRQLLDSGMKGREIAVLYRAHFHCLDVQMELTRQHIPFRITSGLRFFEQAHVKDVIAYLRLLANPYDEMAFRRIAAMLPRVGEASGSKMWQTWTQALKKHETERPDEPVRDFGGLMLPAVKVPPAAQASWSSFLATMSSLRPADHELTPAEMISRVLLDTEAYFTVHYENYEERLEDIEQLSRSMSDTESLDDFLAQVALLSEADRDHVEGNDDCVTLSTIHQAKGLEWKVVFIIFLGEGMFPHSRTIYSSEPREMEEETRLFYVAVTRAQDLLFLSYPRYNGHNPDSHFCPPSQFLTSLPPELYELGEA